MRLITNRKTTDKLSPLIKIKLNNNSNKNYTVNIECQLPVLSTSCLTKLIDIETDTQEKGRRK